VTGGVKNARRGVDPSEATGRLARARAFHLVAQWALEALNDAKMDRAPVYSNAALAAIGYADAVTITAAGTMNQKDHATAVAVLRDALGRDLPADQASNLSALIGQKDQVQYGGRFFQQSAAERCLQQLDEFAGWASAWLADRGVT
jgi:hypothetical protein